MSSFTRLGRWLPSRKRSIQFYYPAPPVQAAFKTQARALFLKNAAFQRRNRGTNIRLLMLPICETSILYTLWLTLWCQCTERRILFIPELEEWQSKCASAGFCVLLAILQVVVNNALNSEDNQVCPSPLVTFIDLRTSGHPPSILAANHGSLYQR